MIPTIKNTNNIKLDDSKKTFLMTLYKKKPIKAVGIKERSRFRSSVLCSSRYLKYKITTAKIAPD